MDYTHIYSHTYPFKQRLKNKQNLKKKNKIVINSQPLLDILRFNTSEDPFLNYRKSILESKWFSSWSCITAFFIASPVPTPWQIQSIFPLLGKCSVSLTTPTQNTPPQNVGHNLQIPTFPTRTIKWIWHVEVSYSHQSTPVSCIRT